MTPLETLRPASPDETGSAAVPLHRLRNRVRLVAAPRLRGLQANGPPLLAAALAVIAVAAGWRGVDWPAQVYRVELVRAHGLIGFDVSWYGGQFPLAYSLLFPALAAATSLAIVAVASAAMATWAFQRLVRDRFGLGGSLAAYLFATATTVQVAIGQLPFLLGFGFALLATLALRRRTTVAIVAWLGRRRRLAGAGSRHAGHLPSGQDVLPLPLVGPAPRRPGPNRDPHDRRTLGSRLRGSHGEPGSRLGTADRHRRQPHFLPAGQPDHRHVPGLAEPQRHQLRGGARRPPRLFGQSGSGSRPVGTSTISSPSGTTLTGSFGR